MKQLISCSATGNILGIVSLIIGLVGLIITVKTMRSAKRIEEEVSKAKVNALLKSKFNQFKPKAIQKIEQKRCAARNQNKLSKSLCTDMISICNDLNLYEELFQDKDLKAINDSKKELINIVNEINMKEIMDEYAKENNYVIDFDTISTKLEKILQKGEYEL